MPSNKIHVSGINYYSATFIVLDNDLHSGTVINMVAEHPYACVLGLKVEWGERPDLSVEQIDSLRQDAVFCGFSDPRLQTMIEKTGRTVIRLRNHHVLNFNQSHNSTGKNISILEQVADVLGHTLSARQDLIAANEQGELPSLLKAAYIAKHNENKNDLGTSSILCNYMFCDNDGNLQEIENRNSAESKNIHNRVEKLLECNSEVLKIRAEHIKISSSLTCESVDSIACKIKDLASKLSSSFQRCPPNLEDPLYANIPNFGNVRVLETGLAGNDHPRTILIQASQSHQPYLYDAVLLWRFLTFGDFPWAAPKVLMVFTEEQSEGSATPGGAVALEFYGPRDLHCLFKELIETQCGEGHRFERLSVFGGGADICFFGAESGTTAQNSSDIKDFATVILNETLQGERPAHRWATNFYAPFQIIKTLQSDTIHSADIECFKNVRKYLEESNAFKRVIPGDQEAQYLSEHCRKRLVPDANYKTPSPALLSYQWCGDHSQDLHILLACHKFATPLHLALRHVRLHLFDNAVCLLEWQIDDGHDCVWTVPDERPHKDDEKPQQDNKSIKANEISADRDPIITWDDFTSPFTSPSKATTANRKIPMFISLAMVLEINARARFMFSALQEGTWGEKELHTLNQLYVEDKILGEVARGRKLDSGPKGGWLEKLLEEMKIPVFNEVFCKRQSERGSKKDWLKNLLQKIRTSVFNKKISNKLSKSLAYLSDDRAITMASLVLMGEQPKLSAAIQTRLNVYRQRISMVDDYGEYPAYDPQFSADELTAASYDRFNSLGIYFSATSHSFTFLGFGWFPLNVIHHLHMPTSYGRLHLIRNAYQATLSTFAREMSERIDSLAEANLANDTKINAHNRERYRDVRIRLLSFTDGWWFRTITDQVQGRELFDKMYQQSTMEQEYHRVSSGIERTDAYLSLRSQEKETKSDATRNIILLIISVSTIIAWLFSAFDGQNIPYFIRSLFLNWWAPVPLSANQQAIAALLLTIFLVGIGGIIGGYVNRMRWRWNKLLICIWIILTALSGALILTQATGEFPVIKTLTSSLTQTSPTSRDHVENTASGISF